MAAATRQGKMPGIGRPRHDPEVRGLGEEVREDQVPRRLHDCPIEAGMLGKDSWGSCARQLRRLPGLYGSSPSRRQAAEGRAGRQGRLRHGRVAPAGERDVSAGGVAELAAGSTAGDGGGPPRRWKPATRSCGWAIWFRPAAGSSGDAAATVAAVSVRGPKRALPRTIA